MAATFTAALAIVSKQRNLTEADRAHLRRWANDDYPKDPTWERLADAAKARGLMPPQAIHFDIIAEALRMRRHAESVASGIDLDFRERKQQRERVLELAKKADDLADYYKWAEAYSGIAMFFSRFFMPVSELEELHRKEAKLLRQRAGRARSQPPV